MELVVLTYEQSRFKYFKERLEAARRTLSYWELRVKPEDSEISPNRIALSHAGEIVSYYTDIVELLEKASPKHVTHEATLYKCCTCPSCKNVVDEFTEFNGMKVRVTTGVCRFCGQKLDWSEE